MREKRVIIVDNCNKEIFARVNDTSIWYVGASVKEGRNGTCLLKRKYSTLRTKQKHEETTSTSTSVKTRLSTISLVSVPVSESCV